MGRSKKTATAASSAPDVLRGCLDCMHKDIQLTKKPCKDCVRWSLWEISKDAAERHARNQAALERVKQGRGNSTEKTRKPRRPRNTKTKEGGATS